MPRPRFGLRSSPHPNAAATFSMSPIKSASSGLPLTRTVSPRRNRFLRRISSGSMPARRATSSICDSPTHCTCVAPNARYEPDGPVFVYTQCARTCVACHRYGPAAASPAVAVTRGPLSAYAPVSSQICTSRLTSSPVLRAVVTMRHFMLCRRVVTIDSLTSLTILTGFFAFRASAAANGSIFV